MTNETHQTTELCDDRAKPLGFFASGWICFREQMPKRPMSANEMAERAFYAGAALFFSGMRRCDEVLGEEERDQTIERILDEVNDYCSEHDVRMEWEQRHAES